MFFFQCPGQVGHRKIKRVDQNCMPDYHVPQASTSTRTATTSGPQTGVPGFQQACMPSATQSQQASIPVPQQASGTSQVFFYSQMLEKSITYACLFRFAFLASYIILVIVFHFNVHPISFSDSCHTLKA